jgi:hypothetical protein
MVSFHVAMLSYHTTYVVCVFVPLLCCTDYHLASSGAASRYICHSLPTCIPSPFDLQPHTLTLVTTDALFELSAPSVRREMVIFR